MQKHTAIWQADLSVPSKYLILFLFPEGVQFTTYTMKQMKQSFEKTVNSQSDEHLSKAINSNSHYFLQSLNILA